MKLKFRKEFKIGRICITFETFRIHNKFLPLPHNLFKNGINKYIDREKNKYLSFVVSNFRIVIVKKNG